MSMNRSLIDKLVRKRREGERKNGKADLNGKIGFGLVRVCFVFVLFSPALLLELRLTPCCYLLLGCMSTDDREMKRAR